MLSRLTRFAFAAAALLTAAACAQPDPVQRLPQMTFDHMAAYRLKVGQLEIVNEFSAPAEKPHVEHLMPVSPLQALQTWAQQRLQPVGTTETMRFVIRDASVVEAPLETDAGFTGLFKREQAKRYTARIDVALKILDERQIPRAEITVQAQRSQTVAEGLTLNQRDRIWFELVESALMDFNAQVEQTIGQYMAPYLM